MSRFLLVFLTLTVFPLTFDPEAVRAAPSDIPAAIFEPWTRNSGAWRVENSAYKQTRKERTFSIAPRADWKDYVFRVRARKIDGKEGFAVVFRAQNPDLGQHYFWNIGGWGNTAHGIETRPAKPGFPRSRGHIETGRWYDIKVVVQGSAIRCYLDGQLIHDVRDETYASGGIGLGCFGTAAEYRNLSVTTLDGKRLYGADIHQWTECLLAELEPGADSLRKELAALRVEGPPPEDPRWKQLDDRVTELACRFRSANKKIRWVDLAVRRQALERLAAGNDGHSAEARKLIDELADCQTRMPRIKASLSRFEEEGLRQAESLLALEHAAETFQRQQYVRRCPPVAFIRCKAHGRRGTNATMHARMTGVGSAICVYDPARPEEGVKTIFDDPKGFIFDMSPSYDAKKLVFAYKKEVAKRQDPLHIYEINIDDTGLRQLTNDRYHDFSPVYLPDGRIVFNSTRVRSYSLCQDFLAAALYVMDAGGSNVRRLEFTTLCDTTPYVMDNGSILFTRWEYQDKNIFCTEALWTINPDGSRVQLFYGNTLTIPNAMYGAKQIPGTGKVICVMAAHHHPPLGGIAIIDRSKGLESVESMRTLTPDVPYRPTKGRNWQETSWGPGDRFYPWSYTDPWPIEEDLFLVSYGGPLEDGPERYRLYLMDDQGSKVPLYDAETISCFNPIPLRPRSKPHVIPGRPPETPQGLGRYFVQDVYQGLLEFGVERGQVKQLRIMSQLPKKYNTEGPRYSDHYPAIGEGTYYVKYNYGTVPVNEDGSAYFTAPAGVELYFQALDASGKEVRRMGTTTQVTVGETQSCIGCHESRFSTPAPNTRALASVNRAPDHITAPPWGAGPVDFVRQVQPVLDKYCVECHQGPTPDGDIDLSGDKTRLFNMAFESLVFTDGLVARYHLNPGPTGNFPPMASGSYVSRLTKLIEERHEDVNLDDESRRKIYTWIDANVPYYGTWDMTRPHSFGGRDTWLDSRGNPLPWFQAFSKAYAAAGLPGEAKQVGHREINLTHPEHSGVLRKHLARSAGGRADDDKAVFQSKDDPLYRQLLTAIEQGKAALAAKPRVDMPGAVLIPQNRDFGRTF